MNRIGLFGGSFDPVHNGHLLVAMAACEEIGLQRVFFIPAAQSPFKPESKPAPPEMRLRLLRLALVGKNNYEVDQQELARGGTSYTIDTVRDYRKRFPDAELFYLIGADHIPQLHKWRSADELARSVEFVAIPRPGQSPPASPAGFRVRALRGFPFGVSSSQIRERIRAGKTIDGLVPAAVTEAIRNSRLYFEQA
jgi:nicotinate-nucleotide adenylyltransferase